MATFETVPVQTTEGYSSPVPPDRRITPTKCSVLADRLAHATRLFEEAGVRVPNLGRLRQGELLLRNVASSGRFPTTAARLAQLGNCIRDSFDFHDVSRLLRDGPTAALAKELDRAMGGTVDQTERQRRPYQFQSQLWVGTMLQYAGLAPRVPPGDQQRRPDYVITVGISQYGVEVKRPESETSISRATHAIVRGFRRAGC
jgi:hypothetical protein